MRPTRSDNAPLALRGRTGLSTLILAALLALLPAACGRTDEAPAAQAPAPPAAGPVAEDVPVRQSGALGPVDVRLTEYAIQMPSSLPAGANTLLVRNEGTEEHNLEIEGQGIEEKLPSPLAPGQTASMQVVLQPGKYEVYCPVADHAEAHGMRGTLVVREP